MDKVPKKSCGPDVFKRRVVTLYNSRASYKNHQESDSAISDDSEDFINITKRIIYVLPPSCLQRHRKRRRCDVKVFGEDAPEVSGTMSAHIHTMVPAFTHRIDQTKVQQTIRVELQVALKQHHRMLGHLGAEMSPRDHVALELFFIRVPKLRNIRKRRIQASHTYTSTSHKHLNC